MKVLSKQDISEFYAKCELDDAAAGNNDLPGKQMVIDNLDDSLNDLRDEVA